MIEIRHLKKSFGPLEVLKDVNAVIEKGEIISIIGPSGTGKSTLLRCMNLLERPTAGEIIVDGVNLLDAHADIPAMRMKIGMVFQQFNLFSHLSVLENVAVSPRKLLRLSRGEAEAQAMELLKKVGLESKAYALPSELSGGQQQRAAIARTLAMGPEVILLDEPTSALDPNMADEVLYVISQLAKTGITMVIVTHQMSFARDISTRIFYMDEGVIYEDGTPTQIFEHPKRQKTLAFIRRIDMEYFRLKRNDLDPTSVSARVRALANRYNLSFDVCRPFHGTVLKLLRDLLFPLSEIVEMRIGVSKETHTLKCCFTWNGQPVNPLESKPELLQEIATGAKNVVFQVNDSGQPQLEYDGVLADASEAQRIVE